MDYSARLVRSSFTATGTLFVEFEVVTPGFSFQAGQASLFSFSPDFPLVDKSRIFSLCSAPSEIPSLSIATRLTPGSAFKEALSKTQPGQTFLVEEATGEFLLPAGETPGSLVFLAGGIGITPFRSMIRELRHRKDSRFRILLLTVNRTGDETPFLPECQEWVKEGTLTWVPVLTREGLSPGSSRQERIEEGLARVLEEAGENSLLYLAGPPGMVDTFHQTLLSQFLIEEPRIKSDMFFGYLSR